MFLSSKEHPDRL